MREVTADKSVVEAAQWLADQVEPLPEVVRVLRSQFNITPSQAAKACTLAWQFRMIRRAFG